MNNLIDTPEEFAESDTIYTDQVKVNASTNMATVTDHVILTRGKWWIPTVGVMTFCIECPKAPPGLPMGDQSTPIGSPFHLSPPP